MRSARHSSATCVAGRRHSGSRCERRSCCCAPSEEFKTKKVAKRLRVSPHTVGKWRGRFVEHRLEGLLDEPRPGAPRKITDDAVEAAVTSRPWKPRPGGLRIGALADSRRRLGLGRAACSGSGTRLASSRTGRRAFSCPVIRSSSRRCATLWGYTCRRLTTRWSSASTRSRRSRRSTGHSRCCLYAPGRSNDEPTTTSATARRRSSPRSTS